MRSLDRVNPTNFLRTHGNADVKIKLNMHKGILDGNILDSPIYPDICDVNTLDFSCKENSQYIAAI